MIPIGIIDNGVLLEEESLEELENRNKKYIKLVTPNDSKAVKVLEDNHFRSTVIQAVQAAAKKSRNMQS